MSWLDGWKPTSFPGVFQGKGAYRVRVRAIDPKTGTLKEANRVYEKITLKQAVAKQVELRDDLQRKETEKARPRVGDFAKSWIESKAAVVSRYTLEGYAYSLDKHVLPVLGAFYFDAVGHLEVQGMVNGWLILRKEDGTRRYSMRSIKVGSSCFAT